MARNWEKTYALDIEDGEWYEFATHTLHYEWCCDCSLRHIIEYRIGKTKSGEPCVLRRCWRDSFASELHRRYNKTKARRVVRRKK